MWSLINGNKMPWLLFMSSSGLRIKPVFIWQPFGMVIRKTSITLIIPSEAELIRVLEIWQSTVNCVQLIDYCFGYLRINWFRVWDIFFVKYLHFPWAEVFSLLEIYLLTEIICGWILMHCLFSNTTYNSLLKRHFAFGIIVMNWPPLYKGTE